MKNLLRMKLIGGTLIVAGALVTNTAPAFAQDYDPAGNYSYAPQPAGQLNDLVSRIALYPDPLLAQIFAAAAFPDQIAAAAQGAGGPFDPSVEALLQYPSVLQMMAADPSWTEALAQAMAGDPGAVMDAIQNLRREAQQYGYLENGPQMQVEDDGGYIDIEPVGGYLYVPIYDPYVVFAAPRPGFFVGGAIRFGGGFHWTGGENRFDWRNHQVVVNRRVWTAPVQRQPQRTFTPPVQRNFTPQQPPQFEQRNFTAPAPQRGFAPAPAPPRSFAPAPQRSFAPAPQRGFAPAPQRSFAPAPQRDVPQRNFAAPRQMEQRSFAPQGGAPQARNRR